MKRRSFLKASLSGLAMAATSGSNLLLQGCRSKKEFDVLFKGALIFNGLKEEGFEADVAIRGDSIVAVGQIDEGRAKRIIDGRSLVLCPGFIDIHDHTDVQLLVNPKAESHAHQGITTLVSGNCGSSPFPLTGLIFEKEKESLRQLYHLELTWQDIRGFFQRLEERGLALNYATLVGHGTIRAAVIGEDNRPPTPEEMAQMKQWLRACLEGGAFGLSTGLEYTPGCFAETREIIELCQVVAQYNGLYATHLRDEGDRLVEALEEAIEIGRQSGVKVEISHFKTAYRRNWPKIDQAIEIIDKARDENLNLTVDRYPYVAASTGLSLYFPLWAREGGTEAFLKRLQDKRYEQELKNYLAEQEKKLGSWNEVLISSVLNEKSRHFQGKTIAQAAQESGCDVFTFMRDLLLVEKGQVGMISFIMSEDNLKRILALPYTLIGCDGSTYSPSGILSQSKPHPRSYGSFPRFLGRYVREEKVCSLGEAIRRITALPAARLGLKDRGIIAPGFKADLVLFDPSNIRDRATWTSPHTFAEGIVAVMVNGELIIEDGQQKEILPGRVLRRV